MLCLYQDQMGVGRNSIAIEGFTACLSIVFVTDAWMYGFHCACNTLDKIDRNLAAFDGYIRMNDIANNYNNSRILGVCNRRGADMHTLSHALGTLAGLQHNQPTVMAAEIDTGGGAALAAFYRDENEPERCEVYWTRYDDVSAGLTNKQLGAVGNVVKHVPAGNGGNALMGKVAAITPTPIEDVRDNKYHTARTSMRNHTRVRLAPVNVGNAPAAAAHPGWCVLF